MSEIPSSGVTEGEEVEVLSTYRRMQRYTAVLSVVAVIGGMAFFGWRCAIGVLIGAVVAHLNMRWLHYGTQLMVERMLSTGKSSKGPLLLTFLGRLGFVIVIAYVIFISSRSAFYGFLVALFLPIAGAVCEAVYEALPRKNEATSLD